MTNDEAISILEDEAYFLYEDDDPYDREAFHMAVAALKAQKHGHWVSVAEFEQCSICHGTRLKEIQTYYGKAIWIKTSYCPHCGAKMEEVSK